MRQENFWHTTIRIPEASNPVAIPDRVDVAVIGGGYTGLSAALTLARRGTKVAVLEAETAGWGASSRNGGMTLTGLKPSMRKVLEDCGKEIAREMFRYSLDSVDTVERVVREEHIECGFARAGHLQTANKPSHYEAFREQADFLAKEFDHEVRLIPPAELPQEIGSTAYHGALVDDLSGGLNPAQYAAGLAGAAERAGATMCARARVTGLERAKDHFSLRTIRGTTKADSVLVATSAYTADITNHLQKRIIPIGSFIVATEKLPDATASKLIPKNRMVFDSRNFLNYYRLWENRLIFGGRAAFFPETVDTVRRSSEILRKQMIRVFPQLQDTKVEYAWGGTLDFAFDMMPHAGCVDGVYHAVGYAGHGVAMATHLGMKLAEAMLSGDVKNIPFARIPFPRAPLGLTGKRPWLLPAAGLWFRLLDILS